MANYQGTSIVDYLKSVGQASDYTSRSNLAKQYGIQNYAGSAQQNTQLLNILKAGTSTTPPPAPTPTPPITQPSAQPPQQPTPNLPSDPYQLAQQMAGMPPSPPQQPPAPTPPAATAGGQTHTIKSGDTLSQIVQKAGITAQQFLALNPQYAAKGGPGDYWGLTGSIQPGQTYVLPGQTAPPPTPGSGTYVEDLAKQNETGTTQTGVTGTSDTSRQAELARIKAELEAGLNKPGVFNSSEEYEKLRLEKGIANDEAEMNAIQNEQRLINEDVRQLSTRTGEMSMGGYATRMSEVERDAQFRLEGLAIKEQAVVDRLNSKNAYINTVMGLKQADYQNAMNDYNNEYSKNLQAINMLNQQMDDAKKDSTAQLQTLTNLLAQSGTDYSALSNATKIQLETLALKAGIPIEIFQSSMTATGMAQPDTIKTVNSRTGAGGMEYFDVLKIRPDGSMYVETVTRGQGKVSTTGGDGKQSQWEWEKTEVSEMQGALNAVSGSDGYVSPNDWNIFKKNWSLGATDFEERFNLYKNPNQPENQYQ